MEYLFASWPSLAAAIGAAPHLLLLSDYDGTLTPIVGRPDEAHLAPGVREKLAALAGKDTVSVGIVSGRSLADIKALAPIEGIYYGGNHGLEIEGPGLSYVRPEAEAARTALHELAGQLAAALGGTAGVIIDDKGLSLSVHYRLVREDEVPAVKAAFRQITAPLLKAGGIRVTTGKKVLEVRPPLDWDKGRAVAAIAGEIGARLGLAAVLTIYLGDDTTDEDAFRVLRPPQGWGIYVGGENPASAAACFLKSPAEVEELLARLLEMR